MIVRTRPNLLTLLFTLRGSILPRVAPKLAGIVAVSCAVVWAEARWPAGVPDHRGRHALHGGRPRPVDLPELPQQRLLRALVGGAEALGQPDRRGAQPRPRPAGAAAGAGGRALHLRRLSAFAHGLHARLRDLDEAAAVARRCPGFGPVRPERHRLGAGRHDPRSGRADARGPAQRHPVRHPGGADRGVVGRPHRLRAARQHAAALRLHAPGVPDRMALLPAPPGGAHRLPGLGDPGGGGARRLHVLRPRRPRGRTGGALRHRAERPAPRRHGPRPSTASSTTPSASRCRRRWRRTGTGCASVGAYPFQARSTGSVRSCS